MNLSQLCDCDVFFLYSFAAAAGGDKSDVVTRHNRKEQKETKSRSVVYSLNFVLNFCIRSNSTDTEYYCSTVKGGKGHQSKRILSPVGVDD